MNPSQNALTDQNYWDDVWNATDIPPKSYPEINSVRNHGKNELHRFFSRHLKHDPPPASVLEFGCAQSTWLPYFARVHTMRVAGLDYSPLGCARADAILKRDNVDGVIYQRDMFTSPTSDIPLYDVGVSFGVIEHFENPSVALKAMAKYIKPGGLILTIIPNMTGITGFLQKRTMNRSIFNLHKQLDASQLGNLHSEAGLAVVQADYLLPLGLGVLNPGDKPPLLTKVIFAVCKIVTALIWTLDFVLLRSLPRLQLFSPYVVCAALVPTNKRP